MFKHFTAIVLLSVLSAASAQAVLIDFDSLADGTIVGGTFPSVTFVDAQTTTIAGDRPGISGANTIFHVTDGFNTLASNPIEAIFDGLASSVSLTGVDIGADGFQLLAYDVFDSLIDSSSAVGVTLTGVGEFFTLTVTGAIKRVEFSQISDAEGSNDGSIYDNFLFNTAAVTPVPSPATYALFGLGLAGLGWSTRKKA